MSIYYTYLYKYYVLVIKQWYTDRFGIIRRSEINVHILLLTIRFISSCCQVVIMFCFREYELIESESQWKEVLRQTNAGSGVQVSFRFQQFRVFVNMYVL